MGHLTKILRIISLQVFVFLLVHVALDSTSIEALPLAGSFQINHRHGATTEHNTGGVASSTKASSDDCQQIMNDLANILANSRIEDRQSKQQQLLEDGDQKNSEIHDDSNNEEARLWKHLGKLCLDAGEYAEASRIFRRGAERCSHDEGLCHHVKVFEAFHGNKYENSEEQGKTNSPPPLQLDGHDTNDDSNGLFLSLQVPPDSIPNSIREMAKKNGCDETSGAESLTRLLHASTEPILSRIACQYIIQCAEDVAKCKGWTTDRHVHAPTCDIPVFDLDPAAIRWMRNAMQEVLFPLLAKSFPCEIGVKANKLRIQDLFVVRYDGDGSEENRPGFASLRPHEDESIISLTIALNDMSDYEGGGLFIASTGDLLNGDSGTVLTFAGELVHGGYPVTKGTRWILTVFLYLDDNLSGKDPGYTLESIEESVAKVMSSSQ
jgi:hypothetical protein